MKKRWCIPPAANAEFVYHMEDVLEVYQRPYDARFPQVCLDEGCKQLLADTREPLPLQPASQSVAIMNMNVKECVVFSWPVNRWRASAFFT